MGGGGADTLIGGASSARFLFGPNFGDDVIDDRIDLGALGTAFANLTIMQSGLDTTP